MAVTASIATQTNTAVSKSHIVTEFNHIFKIFLYLPWMNSGNNIKNYNPDNFYALFIEIYHNIDK